MALVYLPIIRRQFEFLNVQNNDLAENFLDALAVAVLDQIEDLLEQDVANGDDTVFEGLRDDGFEEVGGSEVDFGLFQEVGNQIGEKLLNLGIQLFEVLEKQIRELLVFLLVRIGFWEEEFGKDLLGGLPHKFKVDDSLLNLLHLNSAYLLFN